MIEILFNTIPFSSYLYEVGIRIAMCLTAISLDSNAPFGEMMIRFILIGYWLMLTTIFVYYLALLLVIKKFIGPLLQSLLIRSLR